jgi:2-oxoglutarate ferredoxin oxidoreductase subunit alpha
LRPFPRNLQDILGRFNKVLVPEMNTGQLAMLLRSRFLVEVEQYNKIQGIPITKSELLHAARELLD